MIRTQKARLYPNRTMKKVLDDLCDYRRYCWNRGLALWNDMYDASLIMGILVLTVVNKIKKGKAIFFLNNIEKCFAFLYYSIFYIAANSH